jgi:hypothetical protein
MAYICETGRDRGGIEPVEYCDNRFLDACDIGRGSVDLRGGGDVMRGGKGGWSVFEEGDDTTGGDVAGEVCDMTAVIVEAVSLIVEWKFWLAIAARGYPVYSVPASPHRFESSSSS